MFLNRKVRVKAIVFLALIIIVSMYSKDVLAKDSELDFIHKDAHAVFIINHDEQDPGISFVTGLWKERFEVKETTKKYEAIEKISKELPFQKVVGAVFLPDKPYNREKKPNYPQFIVIVEAPDSRKLFQDALQILIKKRKPLKSISYGGYSITYRDKKLEPYHGQKDLSAYTAIDDYVLIATNPDELTQAIDVYNNDIGSIKENDNFMDLKKDLGKEDIFIFGDNKSKMLSTNLKRWEEKEGIRILLSSDAIAAAGIGLDIETADSLKGQVVFVPRPDDDMLDVKDDAAFFAEVITRSFTKENISWISEVESTKEYVEMEFEGTGFRPIFEDALYSKQIAFLEKEPEPKAETEAPSASVVNHLPKILFIVIVAIAVLALVLMIKGKRK